MHELLQIIVVVVFCILAVLCLGLGATRGNRIKKINGKVISFFIYFMALWYFLAVMTNFKILNWERDDGIFDISVLRFVTCFTVMITFLPLIGYEIKQDVLDVISYLFLCIFVNVSLIVSILSYESNTRSVWICVTFTFTAILVAHLFKDTIYNNLTHARFIRSIIIVVSIYVLLFIFTMLWSPLHQNLIEFKTQEIIMIVADVLVSIFCAFPIVHYGWGISVKSEAPLISPGYISHLFEINATEYTEEQIRDSFHTF